MTSAKMNYVRITFTPSEAARPVTWWAKKLSAKKGVSIYWKVNRFGEEPEPRHMIMGETKEIAETPARMNNYYAELEIGDPQ